MSCIQGWFGNGTVGPISHLTDFNDQPIIYSLKEAVMRMSSTHMHTHSLEFIAFTSCSGDKRTRNLCRLFEPRGLVALCLISGPHSRPPGKTHVAPLRAAEAEHLAPSTQTSARSSSRPLCGHRPVCPSLPHPGTDATEGQAMGEKVLSCIFRSVVIT